MSRHQRILLDGPAGKIEVFAEPHPDGKGIAVIAHPHPLFGGTADNKVVTTLARAFRDLGFHTLRPNFRGVGASEGSHDHGLAETDDLIAVHHYARDRFGISLPVVLAGFSFGAYVMTRVAKTLEQTGHPPHRLVLAGLAAGLVEDKRHYVPENVPADTLIIHGAGDTTVPLGNVLAWAETQAIPITVIPGADHFFHGKLPMIRGAVRSAAANWHLVPDPP